MATHLHLLLPQQSHRTPARPLSRFFAQPALTHPQATGYKDASCCLSEAIKAEHFQDHPKQSRPLSAAQSRTVAASDAIQSVTAGDDVTAAATALLSTYRGHEGANGLLDHDLNTQSAPPHLDFSTTAPQVLQPQPSGDELAACYPVAYQKMAAEVAQLAQDLAHENDFKVQVDDHNVDPQLASELTTGPPSVQMHDALDQEMHTDGHQHELHGDLPHPDDQPDGLENEGDESAEGVALEPFSPRRGFTHKRPEDPPRNEAGKMMCRYQTTCAGLTFDRRCEWSKHMDKHERPYKCKAPGCEKLQGFTYSGGLLRHQREVHKMHGGTKKALYCPEPNCKRNSGAGFTRKENLSEHIRRVHRRATDGTPIVGDGSAPVAPMARMHPDTIEQLEAAAREQLGDDLTDPDLTAAATKRKRQELGLLHENGDESTEVDALRDEIKRLKTDVADRDSRLQNLEDQFEHQKALIQQLINKV